MKRCLIALLNLMPVLACAQASITVDVQLSRASEGGKLMVALCPSADAYASDKGCLAKELTVKSERMRAVFLAVPPGQHAIKVFHDVNSNGKLDTNWMGIPKEPYGFGNDARGSFGPPSFAEAAVTMGQVPVVTSVKLK